MSDETETLLHTLANGHWCDAFNSGGVMMSLGPGDTCRHTRALDTLAARIQSLEAERDEVRRAFFEMTDSWKVAEGRAQSAEDALRAGLALEARTYSGNTEFQDAVDAWFVTARAALAPIAERPERTCPDCGVNLHESDHQADCSRMQDEPIAERPETRHANNCATNADPADGFGYCTCRAVAGPETQE